MFETGNLAPPPVVDDQEIHRRSKLTPAESRKEMREGRNVENARYKKIERPSLSGTSKPITEPPDIIFRRPIIKHKDEIDRLLTCQTIHFRQRCLDYEREDACLELKVLLEYGDWARSMLIHALARERNRQGFFRYSTTIL